jgi:taurine dioxygenase
MPISKAEPRLHLTPQAHDFGARVSGVCLARFTDRAYAQRWAPAIRRAWLRYQVLSFADQPLTQAELLAVRNALGPGGSDPYLRGLPDCADIVEVKREADERASPFGSGWHSDWSFQERPPAATLLLAKVIPPIGGETWYADGFRAFEALPPWQQAQLAETTAVHSARRPYSPKGFAAGGGARRSMDIVPSDSAYGTVRHPVLRTHPESGRTALWLNPVYVIDLQGPHIAAGEAEALLADLCRHLTREAFIYRHRWQADMLTLWDNRSVAHCARGGYDGYRRLLQRTTVAGDEPCYRPVSAGGDSAGASCTPHR